MPTIRQAPPETLDDRIGRILRLDEPPDELGVYSIAYSIKHDFVNPIWRWIANEPQSYLDADHNVRTSSVHRDYSHEMAPVLAQATLILLPGANALARGEGFAVEGTVTRFHGTTPSAAARIAEHGFRPGRDGAVFFAEDLATATHFARAAAAARGASGATVLRLTMPESVAAGLQRGTLGTFRGAPALDIAGGTGFEQILLGSDVAGFNSAMGSGVIQVQRLRVGF